MFARKLASIENLKRSEQEMFEGVRALNTIEKSKSITNSFDDLFNLFFPLALTFFVDIL